MPSMDFSPIGFQEYQPHPEDLCSLCGGNFGKDAMIEGKNNIHICMECVDLLSDIKKEREKKKREDICDKIYGALSTAERDGNRSDMAEAVFDAIAAGNIPGVRIE